MTVTQRHLLLKGSIGTLGIEDEAMATIRTIIGLAVPFFIIGPILMSCLFQWLNSSRHPCRAIIEDEVAKENNKRCCCLFSSSCSKCCETSKIIENSSQQNGCNSGMCFSIHRTISDGINIADYTTSYNEYNEVKFFLKVSLFLSTVCQHIGQTGKRV